jgi:hypothetical protein
MSESEKRKAAQRRRLSAALRENLKRRKAQARVRAAALASGASGQRGNSISARAGHSPKEGSSARAAPAGAERPPAPHDSAGIGADKRKS